MIVADDIDALPFNDDNVLFVKGPILERETYLSARAGHARMAIVLATSYADSNSDAVVASAVSVIEGVNPNIRTVAECLNHRHRALFDSVRCNALVCTLRISANLLVQEAHDPGIAQMVDVITSNVRGTTVFSTAVTAESPSVSSCDLTRSLLNSDINVLCVNRGNESHTLFKTISSQPGDRLVYAGPKHLSWPELLSIAEL